MSNCEGCESEVARLLVTCEDQSGIVQAVSGFFVPSRGEHHFA